jgi:argininosuccinate lyase
MTINFFSSIPCSDKTLTSSSIFPVKKNKKLSAYLINYNARHFQI